MNRWKRKASWITFTTANMSRLTGRTRRKDKAVPIEMHQTFKLYTIWFGLSTEKSSVVIRNKSDMKRLGWWWRAV